MATAEPSMPPTPPDVLDHIVETPPPLRPGRHWRPTLLAASLIVLVGTAVYWNSFAGVFVIDDITTIVNNPAIHQWWRLDKVLCPATGDLKSTEGRPLLSLSLAINYAICGTQIWGYHLVNLVLHLCNALLLFDLLGRTFQRPVLPQSVQKQALPLALIITGLWTVHPLQTEAVTYIIQRAESQVSLFYLLMLYGLVRSVDSGRSGWWKTGSVIACLLGMASKEMMVTAPVMAIFYDRTFLAGSFGEAWRRRRGLYLGLAATWFLLLGLVLASGEIFLGDDWLIQPRWPYALTQPKVILHHLRLTFWPCSQCASYAWPVLKSWQEILPSLTVVLVIGIVSLWALVRRPMWGFLGMWFFGILVPTSSIVPLRDVIVERRMYLPLAAVLTLLTLAGFGLGRAVIKRGWISRRAGGRLGVCAVIVLGTTWGMLSVARNRVYHSELAIWEDTVAKSPHHACAHNILGLALASAGREQEAIERYQEAIRLMPNLALAHNNLANALMNANRLPEAMEHYREAIRFDPANGEMHNNLGFALARTGRFLEAIEQHQEATRLDPENAKAYNNLGLALAGAGRLPEAIENYQQAIRLKPSYVEAHNNLGNALANTGRLAEAIEQYQLAIQIDPEDAGGHNNLGVVLADVGRFAEAIEHLELAIRLNPNDPLAQNNLGRELSRAGRLPEAITHYQQAIRLNPDYAEAHYNLALALMKAGRVAEAIEHGKQAVKGMPSHLPAIRWVAWLMATHEPADPHDLDQAVELAERACTLTGRGDSACLDILAAAYAAAGQFDKAVVTAREAWQIARAAGQESLAEEIHVRLQLYRDRKPYREPVAVPTSRKL